MQFSILPVGSDSQHPDSTPLTEMTMHPKNSFLDIDTHDEETAPDTERMLGGKEVTA